MRTMMRTMMLGLVLGLVFGLVLGVVFPSVVGAQPVTQFRFSLDVADRMNLGCCIVGTIEGDFVVVFDYTVTSGYDEWADQLSVRRGIQY